MVLLPLPVPPRIPSVLPGAMEKLTSCRISGPS